MVRGIHVVTLDELLMDEDLQDDADLFIQLYERALMASILMGDGHGFEKSMKLTRP